MKKLMMMVLGLMCAVGMAGMAVAGNIDSPGPPSGGSGMYTLQQVYNYLSAGTVPTIPGSFQEPSAGPGSTMKTTKEIVAAIATPFAQVSGPATADVKKDVKFFSTASGSWGVQTGTAPGAAAFGAWQSKSVMTVYQATTDGFVVALCTRQGGAPIYVWADTFDPPTTVRAVFEDYENTPYNQGTLTVPIAVGEYWKAGSGVYKLWWRPLCLGSDCPTPTPTPTMPPQLVQIGAMWVAKGTNSPGTFSGIWNAASDWSNDLVWLGYNDWRLPDSSELAAICAARASLEGYTADWTWGRYNNGGVQTADAENFGGSPECAYYMKSMLETHPARAVRIR